MSFDPECLNLARHFLSERDSSSAEADQLATTIQDAVEGWFSERDNAPMPPCECINGQHCRGFPNCRFKNNFPP